MAYDKAFKKRRTLLRNFFGTDEIVALRVEIWYNLYVINCAIECNLERASVKQVLADLKKVFTMRGFEPPEIIMRAKQLFFQIKEDWQAAAVDIGLFPLLKKQDILEAEDGQGRVRFLSDKKLRTLEPKTKVMRGKMND